MMGEKMDHRWDHQEETSLRHHLTMLKFSCDRIKNLWWGRGLILTELWLQDHPLCMMCYESTYQDRRDHVTVKLGKYKSPTTMVDHM